MQENNFNYHVYPEQTVRVITTTDAKCEADDQYAIVHALLTPNSITADLSQYIRG